MPSVVLRCSLAVDVAHKFIDDAFSYSAVEGEDEKFTAYSIAEQKAVAEGLLRAWWIHRGGRFLQEFEVLEVEQEGRATLASSVIRDPQPGVSYPVVSDDIELMVRPDAIVRERETGDLYIVSWKTCSTFGAYTINSCNTDMLSMSETWGKEQQFRQSLHSVDTARIEGTLYLFAVKGKRQLDDYLGHYVQNTPLSYGWVRKGPTPDDDEWALTYSYLTGEINPKTGKESKTTLGKGWRKVPIWSDYPGGVEQWIHDLSTQRITPRHVICFVFFFLFFLSVCWC